MFPSLPIVPLLTQQILVESPNSTVHGIKLKPACQWLPRLRRNYVDGRNEYLQPGWKLVGLNARLAPEELTRLREASESDRKRRGIFFSDMEPISPGDMKNKKKRGELITKDDLDRYNSKTFGYQLSVEQMKEIATGVKDLERIEAKCPFRYIKLEETRELVAGVLGKDVCNIIRSFTNNRLPCRSPGDSLLGAGGVGRRINKPEDNPPSYGPPHSDGYWTWVLSIPYDETTDLDAYLEEYKTFVEGVAALDDDPTHQFPFHYRENCPWSTEYAIKKLVSPGSDGSPKNFMHIEGDIAEDRNAIALVAPPGFLTFHKEGDGKEELHSDRTGTRHWVSGRGGQSRILIVI